MILFLNFCIYFIRTPSPYYCLETNKRLGNFTVSNNFRKKLNDFEIKIVRKKLICRAYI